MDSECKHFSFCCQGDKTFGLVLYELGQHFLTSILLEETEVLNLGIAELAYWNKLWYPETIENEIFQYFYEYGISAQITNNGHAVRLRR